MFKKTSILLLGILLITTSTWLTSCEETLETALDGLNLGSIFNGPPFSKSDSVSSGGYVLIEDIFNLHNISLLKLNDGGSLKTGVNLTSVLNGDSSANVPKKEKAIDGDKDVDEPNLFSKMMTRIIAIISGRKELILLCVCLVTLFVYLIIVAAIAVRSFMKNSMSDTKTNYNKLQSYYVMDGSNCI